MKNEKTYLIAEIGQAHDGSLGMAHSLIDAISPLGVNAIKFQMHYAAYESSKNENFRINFSYEDKSRFDYWKRMEFSKEQWEGLKQHCEQSGLDFIVTPFSCYALQLCQSMNVQYYKIGSGDFNNYLLLDQVIDTGKKVFISNGLANENDISQFFKRYDESKDKITLLECTTMYPTLPDEWKFRRIPQLRTQYGLPVGYSDHSGTIESAIAARCFGAEAIEFHACFHHGMFGPDSTSSLDISQIQELCKSIKNIDTALSSGLHKCNNSNYVALFSRSITINKPMNKGDKIHLYDLESTKPAGMGISTDKYDKIIGKYVNKDIPKHHFLQFTDLK